MLFTLKRGRNTCGRGEQGREELIFFRDVKEKGHRSHGLLQEAYLLFLVSWEPFVF